MKEKKIIRTKINLRLVISHKHIPHVRPLSHRDIPPICNVLDREFKERPRRTRARVRSGEEKKNKEETKRKRGTFTSADIARKEDVIARRSKRARKGKGVIPRQREHRDIATALAAPCSLHYRRPVDYLADNHAAATYLPGHLSLLRASRNILLPRARPAY